MTRKTPRTEQLQMFPSGDPSYAATAKRDEAIERADARATRDPGGERLVTTIMAQLRTLTTFTADDVAARLDAAGVARDLVTRRRLASTIVNRGRKKFWVPNGFEVSDDPRRNARPITRWRVVA